VLLGEMTWREAGVAAQAGCPVILPLGSTEQHGFHLPLSTDCVLPVAIAMAAARRYPLVVAPPICYGAKSRPRSGGGEGFPGTLSLQAGTFIALVRDVVEALARSGFRRICVSSFHFENAGLAWEAVDVADRGDATVLLLDKPFPDLSAAELDEIFNGRFGGWDVEHAAYAETSMMLAARGDLVRESEIVDDAASRRPDWDVLPHPPELVSRTGVLAPAKGSNRRSGQRLLDIATDRLVEALTTEFGAPEPYPSDLRAAHD